MNSFRTVFQRVSRNAFQAKRSMAGHAHSGPNKWAAANKEFGIELHEASNFHKGAANILLVTMWVWVMYRTKEDKGKMFGWHKPWLEPHAHEHYEWVNVEGFSMSGADEDVLAVGDEH